MKRRIVEIVFILFSAIFIFTGISYAGGIGTYSQGYRMGQITKFSIKGMMLKSGEGQMLIGVNSTPYTTPEGKQVNPWYFSSPKSSTEVNKQLDIFNGEYAVLEYKQYYKKMPNVDTEYEIISVSDISTEKLEGSCQIDDFDDIWGDGQAGLVYKSKGKRSGRVVKASEKGTIVDSYEIMVQQGNAGNQFKNLSVRDVGVYNCIVKSLKAGQKVKLYYVESHINIDVTGRETNYDVIKVEPLKSKFED